MRKAWFSPWRLRIPPWSVGDNPGLCMRSGRRKRWSRSRTPICPCMHSRLRTSPSPRPPRSPPGAPLRTGRPPPQRVHSPRAFLLRVIDATPRFRQFHTNRRSIRWRPGGGCGAWGRVGRFCYILWSEVDLARQEKTGDVIGPFPAVGSGAARPPPSLVNSSTCVPAWRPSPASRPPRHEQAEVRGCAPRRFPQSRSAGPDP